MVTIPRYQSRTSIPLGGQSFERDYGRSYGDDFRTVAQGAKAAGAVVEAARPLVAKLFKPRRAEAGQSPTPSTPAVQTDAARVPAASDATPDEAVSAYDADASFGESARDILSGLGSRVGQGLKGVGEQLSAARQTAGQSLSGAAKDTFDGLSEPRQAGYLAEAAGGLQQAADAAAQIVAGRREAVDLQDYLRQADVAPEQAKRSLASAIGQRGARLMAQGSGAAEIRASQRDLLVQAYAARIAGAIPDSPEQASALIAEHVALLPEDIRSDLEDRIASERLRLEARTQVAALAAGMKALADGEGDLMDRARVAAGENPARVAAYRGAVLGAVQAARARRDEAEDAAWGAVAPYLAAGSSVHSATEMPGVVWAALSDRQKAAVEAHFATPWKDSAPTATADLKDLAARDPEAFRAADLGAMVGGLSVADLGQWRALQQDARTLAGDWPVQQARLGQMSRVIDAATHDLPEADAAAARPSLYAAFARGAVLAGRALDRDELVAICDEEGFDVMKFLGLRWKGPETPTRAKPAPKPPTVAAPPTKPAAPPKVLTPAEKKQQVFVRRRREALDLRDRSPEVRAMLRVVAWAEGDVTYNSMVGDRRGKVYDREIPATHPGRVSGRYQINTDTWKQFGIEKLGLTDYSADSQDMAAVQMLIDAKMVDSLLAGDFGTAIKQGARRWASFPDPVTGVSRYTMKNGKLKSSTPQPSKKLSVLQAHYDQYLAEERVGYAAKATARK